MALMGYLKVENESQLVKSLSKGNLLAFNTLYKEYSSRLYRFAFGYLKSEVDTEELIQDVFTKIWEIRKDLKEDLSFRSYLFTITFNCIKKHFRKKAYISGYFKNEVFNDLDIRTSQEITYESLYQYIIELVKMLPERRREIFMKSRFEGQSIYEIAQELKISHKTVENQITASLKFIRTHIRREDLAMLLYFILFVS